MQKKKKINPVLKQILIELEDVVRRLGYNVRYEKGNFEGGYCIIKETHLIVINTRSEIDKRIVILARNLKNLGIEGLYIKPTIREIIDTGALPTKLDKELINAEEGELEETTDDKEGDE